MSILLQTSEARVMVGGPVPGGACITEYTLTDGRQVFRSPMPDDPLGVACLPMLPWCNRIAGGVTTADGFHPVAPNVPGQDCPLHGSGFQSTWQVQHQGPDVLLQGLTSSTPAPFHFIARHGLQLRGADLSVYLSITHMDVAPLAYGLGLHPWFPRAPGTVLQARSTHFQTVDRRMLPTGQASIETRADWDFSDPNVLPDDLIDTCFSGWDGQAQILWRDRGLRVEIETNPKTNWYQVYSPSSDSGFFCFEPVSHPIDAHNSPGTPGLSILNQGGKATLRVTFRPRRLQ